MSDIESTEPTVEDYREWYEEWFNEYGTGQWLDKTDENWGVIQQVDPHLVWTAHSTCEDEMVTNGAHLFQGSCCWTTFGWYISDKPWEGTEDTYISQKTSAYISCQTCNPDGEEESIDPECLECEGDGYVHHYFD